MSSMSFNDIGHIKHQPKREICLCASPNRALLYNVSVLNTKEHYGGKQNILFPTNIMLNPIYWECVLKCSHILQIGIPCKIESATVKAKTR